MSNRAKMGGGSTLSHVGVVGVDVVIVGVEVVIIVVVSVVVIIIVIIIIFIVVTCVVVSSVRGTVTHVVAGVTFTKLARGKEIGE